MVCGSSATRFSLSPDCSFLYALKFSFDIGNMSTTPYVTPEQQTMAWIEMDKFLQSQDKPIHLGKNRKDLETTPQAQYIHILANSGFKNFSLVLVKSTVFGVF